MRSFVESPVRGAAALAFVASASLAAAQAPVSDTAPVAGAVTPGTRVRITRTYDGPRTGTLVALGPDTALVRWQPGEPVAEVPLVETTRFEVAHGHRRQSLRGAGTGLLVGAVSGFVLGAATYTGCEGQTNCLDIVGSAEGAGAIGGIVLGGVGVVLGAVVGAFVRSERWRTVPLARARVGYGVPAPGRGAGLVARVTF
jgi:hypothetical protein